MRPSLWKIGWHFWVFVEPDRDQSVADKPRFHREPPGGFHLVVSSVRHMLYCPPILLANQIENLGSVLFGQSQSAGLVVEDAAGSAALQRSFGTVIEVVDNRFDLGPQFGANGSARMQVLCQS